MQCASIAWSGSINSARSWAGIFGTAIFGFIQFLVGREVMFAQNVAGAIAYTITCTLTLWILIFGYKLVRAPGIARRRNMPLQVLFGSEEPFYEIDENENIVDQIVSVELKNISDVPVRHCRLQLMNIQPDIGRLGPIFIRDFLFIDSGKAERIQIAYFKKAKLTSTRMFGLCVPLAPVIGSNMLTIPEGAYDIAIEALCDEAKESRISNCHLWIDEDDALRLDAR